MREFIKSTRRVTDNHIFKNNYLYFPLRSRGCKNKLSIHLRESGGKKNQASRVPEERFYACMHGDWQHNGAYLH